VARSVDQSAAAPVGAGALGQAPVAATADWSAGLTVGLEAVRVGRGERALALGAHGEADDVGGAIVFLDEGLDDDGTGALRGLHLGAVQSRCDLEDLHRPHGKRTLRATVAWSGPLAYAPSLSASGRVGSCQSADFTVPPQFRPARDTTRRGPGPGDRGRQLRGRCLRSTHCSVISHLCRGWRPGNRSRRHRADAPARLARPAQPASRHQSRR
jgi:hypothetical protein